MTHIEEALYIISESDNHVPITLAKIPRPRTKIGLLTWLVHTEHGKKHDIA